MGVTDKPPREIVGSESFRDIDAHLKNWQTAIGRFIERFEVFDEADRRVLILKIAGRPAGEYVTYKGVPYCRVGESIGQMPAERMLQIALENTDVSAQPVPGLSLDDLDPNAVAVFRDGVIAKQRSDSAKERYRRMPTEALLDAAGLLRSDGQLNRAALLLLGTERAIRERMAYAEVIFEYRSKPGAVRYDVREVVRRPLMLGVEALWQEIQPFAATNPIEVQTGTRVVLQPRYAERSVREALLNAGAHRDYTVQRPVEVYLSPEAFEVQSPGPFPQGVTPENVADEKKWRNQILAEAMDKCGLIERSGQGVNLMMAAAIRQAQPLPVFEEPEQRAVKVTLHGESDAGFLPFTQQIAASEWEDMPPALLRAIDAMRRRVPFERMDRSSVEKLLDMGIVQRTAEGYLRPSDSYLRSLPDEDRRQLGIGGLKDRLVELLHQHEPVGLKLTEIEALFPDQSRRHLRRLLDSIRGTRVEMRGKTKGARWHPISETEGEATD